MRYLLLAAPVLVSMTLLLPLLLTNPRKPKVRFHAFACQLNHDWCSGSEFEEIEHRVMNDRSARPCSYGGTWFRCASVQFIAPAARACPEPALELLVPEDLSFGEFVCTLDALVDKGYEPSKMRLAMWDHQYYPFGAAQFLMRGRYGPMVTRWEP